MKPHEKKLRMMLEELKANAHVASLPGHERLDFSSDQFDRAALSGLPAVFKDVIDRGYGAVKKVQVFVRKFENASLRDHIDAGNSLIAVKNQELPKIAQAVAEIEKYLSNDAS